MIQKIERYEIIVLSCKRIRHGIVYGYSKPILGGSLVGFGHELSEQKENTAIKKRDEKLRLSNYRLSIRELHLVIIMHRMSNYAATRGVFIGYRNNAF